MILAVQIASLDAGSNQGDLELTLYTKTSLGDGQQANNPWLQEMPDPITRTTWDNYVTVSKADAANMGLVNENVANGGLNGSYVNINMNGVVIQNVPVLIQPGQAKGSVRFSTWLWKNSRYSTRNANRCKCLCII